MRRIRVESKVDMDIEHHDLHHEFPQHGAAIHALKIGNAHFSRLFGDYHRLTGEIERLETEGAPVADALLEDMKKRRLRLKDELYVMIQSHGS